MNYLKTSLKTCFCPVSRNNIIIFSEIQYNIKDHLLGTFMGERGKTWGRSSYRTDFATPLWSDCFMN